MVQTYKRQTGGGLIFFQKHLTRINMVVIFVIDMIVKHKQMGPKMKNYTVYEYGNGTWAVKLPYKTTCWATKKAAEENAELMKEKHGEKK